MLENSKKNYTTLWELEKKQEKKMFFMNHLRKLDKDPELTQENNLYVIPETIT